MYSDKPVLVGYDGSTHSGLALAWAVDEARRRHLRLTILHASAPELVPAGMGLRVHPPDGDPHLADGESLLAEAKTKALQLAPNLTVTTRLVPSAAAVALLEAAVDSSVVVVGSRGLDGFTELMVGSVSLHLATHARVPVVVVRTKETVDAGTEAGRVVVGVDSSDAAQDALAFAFDAAHLRGLGVTAVHAWHSQYYDSAAGKGGAIPPQVEGELFVDDETAALHKAVSGWRDKYGEVDVREVVVHSTPARALVEASKGAEMLVVGSRGRGGFRSLLLGSVSHAAMHHAACPVVVVRPFVAT